STTFISFFFFTDPATPEISTLSLHDALPILGQAVALNASQSSTAADGVPIVNYFWSFGDGTPNVGTSSPTTSHSYAAAGQFNITLTVLDAKGRSGTLIRGMTINP